MHAILRQKNICISSVNLKKIQKRGNFWTLEKDNNVYKIRSLLNPIIKFPKKKIKKSFPSFFFFDVPKQNGAILGHHCSTFLLEYKIYFKKEKKT